MGQAYGFHSVQLCLALAWLLSISIVIYDLLNHSFYWEQRNLRWEYVSLIFGVSTDRLGTKITCTMIPPPLITKNICTTEVTVCIWIIHIRRWRHNTTLCSQIPHFDQSPSEISGMTWILWDQRVISTYLKQMQVDNRGGGGVVRGIARHTARSLFRLPNIISCLV